MREQDFQDALKFLLLNEGRCYLIDLPFSFVLVRLEFSQHLPLFHICLEDSDKLCLLFALLAVDLTCFCLHLVEFLVDLLELMILLLKK